MPDENHPSPLLQVTGLTKHFREQTGWMPSTLNGTAASSGVVKAVRDVSFEVHSGDTYGFLGESGCGKTTLARVLLRLTEPTNGEVLLDGRNVFDMSPEETRTVLRSRARMIFQHPDAVLNPAYTVGTVLDQALRLHTNLSPTARKDRARDLLDQVHLPPDYVSKYAHELSGGQKRRVGLCRALATNPDLIVADEPFSGLDVSLKEQIVGLFQEIQSRHNLTAILISHDIGLIRRLCDRVGIMKEGALVDVLRDGAMAPDDCTHSYSTSLLGTHLEVREND
jgi:ABC-type glutathione transport system ATPase component